MGPVLINLLIATTKHIKTATYRKKDLFKFIVFEHTVHGGRDGMVVEA